MLRPDQFTTISRARDDRASVRRRISELSGLRKDRQSSIISQSFFTCPPRVSLLFQPLSNSLAASNDLRRWKNNLSASLSQRFVRDTKIHIYTLNVSFDERSDIHLPFYFDLVTFRFNRYHVRIPILRISIGPVTNEADATSPRRENQSTQLRG